MVVADNGDCTAARPRGSQAAAAKRAAVHAAGPCTVTFAGGALLHVRVLGASIRDSPSGVACSDLPLVLYTGAGASVARPVGYTVTAWGGDLLQDLCGGARREPGARCALLGGAAHQEDTRRRSPAATIPPQATCEQVRSGAATDCPPAVVEISGPK